MIVGVSGKNLLPYIGSVTVKQSAPGCKTAIMCKFPIGCNMSVMCGLPINCGSKIMCSALIACGKKIVCGQKISGGLTCDFQLMCKGLVSCSMAVGGSCPAIRPEDWDLFDEIRKRFGIADMIEFARQADSSPGIRKKLESLPKEVRKPIEMMLERIRSGELYG
jgi:hypothetical protein